ncbi:MAG: amidohydrolase [Proteobacteria bacterium]|jgi:predicted amidohydrolase YtcJ|nr:amidohydrolase [Pseudomonadota bacterium]
MTIWWRLAVITTALALSACDQPTNPINTADAPDMVLLGGKVLTVDANNATAEAIAITGNRISAVGGTTEIRALVGENTSIVELDGRTVIPGLTDSHIHVIRAGLTWAQEISWADIPTLDEALGRVRNAAASTPDGEWLIVAGGWHKFQFVEKRLPSAAEVSEAAGNHPIYVQYLYDTAILNQAAMSALSIATDADVPPNGTLRLDASGAPTGEIDGTIGVFHRLQGALPKPDFATQVAGTKQFMAELNRLGMTSFSDGSGGSQYPEGYKPLFHIWQNGEMTMRVAYRLMSQNRGQELADLQNLTQLLPQGFGDDWLRFNGFGEVIIWGMHDGSRARPEFNPSSEARASLVETLTWIAENRYSMEIHASSDSSAQQILDILDDINNSTPIADLRWSILHIDAASNSTLTRMKALGVAYGIQDRLYFDGETLVETFGAEHARSAPPLKTALNTGLMVVGGTDAPAVGPYNPWVAVRWILDGKTVNGVTIRSAEEIPSREEALRMYTQNGAWLQFAENERGSIETGKLADIAILSDDYMNMPVEDLNQITSLLTIVDGEVVYADAPFTNSAP